MRSQEKFSHSQRFRQDIENLVRSGVVMSADAFSAVLRTAPSGQQGLEDLEWAKAFIYDHWNFEDGHEHYRQWLEATEVRYENAKAGMQGAAGQGGQVTITAGQGGSSGVGGGSIILCGGNGAGAGGGVGGLGGV